MPLYHVIVYIMELVEKRNIIKKYYFIMRKLLILLLSLSFLSCNTIAQSKICVSADCKDTVYGIIDTLSLNGSVTPIGKYTYNWKNVSGGGTILNANQSNSSVVGITKFGTYIYSLTVSGITVYDTVVYKPYDTVYLSSGAQPGFQTKSNTVYINKGGQVNFTSQIKLGNVENVFFISADTNSYGFKYQGKDFSVFNSDRKSVV